MIADRTDPATGLPIELPNSPVSGNPAELFEHLIAVMLASRQGFALYDETDTLRFANGMFRDLFTLTETEFPAWSEIMRRSYAATSGISVETPDFDLWLRSAQSRRGKLPYRTFETNLHDGRWVLITETTLPGGWMLSVLTDVSELGSDARALRHERDQALKSSLSDELTGLSNRRYLMLQLSGMMGPEKVVGATVALFDIDRFKTVNDTYGHDHGDRVLRHFSSVIQSVAGRDDLFGRLGGEEFLMVIRGPTPSGAIATVQKVFDRLHDGIGFADMPEFRYTSSAGVAHALPGETPEQILRRADQALYRAKNTGRDRFLIAEIPA